MGVGVGVGFGLLPALRTESSLLGRLCVHRQHLCHSTMYSQTVGKATLGSVICLTSG